MHTDYKRRIFLRGSLATGSLAIAAGAGLLAPTGVLAAWNEAAFGSKQIPDALKALMGNDMTEPSQAIDVKAPDIAENGAVVPITVDASGIAGVSAIAIIASNNPSPLAASFDLGEAATGFVSIRIKMGKTGDVVAVAKANDKLLSARKGVKVTIGGCGG